MVSQVSKTMEVKLGELYINRTLRYLVPALKYYGDTFKTKFNLVYKLAFGVYDALVEGTHLEGQKNLYVLVDRTVRPDLFKNFSDWIKYQEYYVTDYVYDTLERGRLQMFVIAFPYELSDAYDKFCKGKYSLMYTKEEINLYFKDSGDMQNIFYKRDIAIPNFVRQVKETFGSTTIIDPEDLRKKRYELDLPPTKKEEFFNPESQKGIYI